MSGNSVLFWKKFMVYFKENVTSFPCGFVSVTKAVFWGDIRKIWEVPTEGFQLWEEKKGLKLW